jgi:tRNA(Arg) A34 adenosine deaminase TadA
MPQNKGTVLIVEKNDVTRKLLVGILNSHGYQTYDAPEADDAVVFLNKGLALVVLDVEGKMIDTMGMVHKLRREFPRLPVVAMAESHELPGLELKIGTERVSTLEKPVMPHDLLHNIEVHLIEGVEHKVDAEIERARREAPVPHESEARRMEARAVFMRRAIDLSQEKSEQNCGGPFGAVIVKNGHIVAEGWSAVTSTNDPTAHAEIMAIRKATEFLGDYQLAGCEIYCSCEPCPMCLSAIYLARLDRLFYANTREDAVKIGFDDDLILRELTLQENKRSLPCKMLLRDEAQIIMSDWLKKPDKIIY